MEKKKIGQRIREFFNNDAPMSNGNKYEVHKELQVQKELDLQTLEKVNNALRNDEADLNTLTTAIRRLGEDLVREKNIEPYFLLQLQADYFCNTCKFETDNISLRRMVINVIRGAFFMGTAGIYNNTKLGILEPVYITNMQYGIDGELKSCRIIPLSCVLQKMNETKSIVNDFDLKGFREIGEEDCKSLAVFSWGTMGYSCWIRIWPFIKLQHMMLTIIIINGYVYNKKWIYRINNYTNITKEIELFFNSANPFIVNIGNTEDQTNRFSTEEGAKSTNTSDVIDYYNKMMGIYYHLLGRKINNDVKKERNVSNEVEASQENYDIVQSDWLNQFEMFVEQLKEFGLNIEVVEQEQQEEEEDYETDTKDNTSTDTGGE